jgi:hypothetical protein
VYGVRRRGLANSIRLDEMDENLKEKIVTEALDPVHHDLFDSPEELIEEINGFLASRCNAIEIQMFRRFFYFHEDYQTIARTLECSLAGTKTSIQWVLGLVKKHLQMAWF